MNIYIYIYKCVLKSSYDDVISVIDDFFTNGIKALQHRWSNECTEHKELKNKQL